MCAISVVMWENTLHQLCPCCCVLPCLFHYAGSISSREMLYLVRVCTLCVMLGCHITAWFTLCSSCRWYVHLSLTCPYYFVCVCLIMPCLMMQSICVCVCATSMCVLMPHPSLCVFMSYLYVFMPHLCVFMYYLYVFMPHLCVFMSYLYVFMPHLCVFIYYLYVFMPHLCEFMSYLCVLMSHLCVC